MCVTALTGVLTGELAHRRSCSALLLLDTGATFVSAVGVGSGRCSGAVCVVIDGCILSTSPAEPAWDLEIGWSQKTPQVGGGGDGMFLLN